MYDGWRKSVNKRGVKMKKSIVFLWSLILVSCGGAEMLFRTHDETLLFIGGALLLLFLVFLWERGERKEYLFRLGMRERVYRSIRRRVRSPGTGQRQLDQMSRFIARTKKNPTR